MTTGYNGEGCLSTVTPEGKQIYTSRSSYMQQYCCRFPTLFIHSGCQTKTTTVVLWLYGMLHVTFVGVIYSTLQQQCEVVVVWSGVHRRCHELNVLVEIAFGRWVNLPTYYCTSFRCSIPFFAPPCFGFGFGCLLACRSPKRLVSYNNSSSNLLGFRAGSINYLFCSSPELMSVTLFRLNVFSPTFVRSLPLPSLRLRHHSRRRFGNGAHRADPHVPVEWTGCGHGG